MGRSVEGRRHLRASTAPTTARDVYSIDTPPPTVTRLAARRARLLLHAHRPDRPLPADARQGGLLPDGLGRQRAADRTPRAELLRRALRPVAALRRRLHAAGEARPQAAGADQPAQLHRALRAAHRAGRGGRSRQVWRTARPLRRLVAALHDDRPRRPSARVAARVPAQLRPWRGLPRRGADAVGRHLPDRRGPGRARGARVRRPLPPGRVPPARRGAGVGSRPPVPS